MNKHKLIYHLHYGSDTVSEYLAIHDEHNDMVVLKHHGNDWTPEYRNKNAVLLVDTGNGYHLSLGKRRIALNYSEAEEIRLALHHLDHIQGATRRVRKYQEVR